MEDGVDNLAHSHRDSCLALAKCLPQLHTHLALLLGSWLGGSLGLAREKSSDINAKVLLLGSSPGLFLCTGNR